MDWKIAFGTDDSVFGQNRILDRNFAAKYPGPLWAVELKERLAGRFEMVTGDIALSCVLEGRWQVRHVAIIQHLHDSVCQRLIRMGAKPLMLTTFESPLYASNFYEHPPAELSAFAYRIFFSGLHKLYPVDIGESHNVRYPSFSLSELNRPVVPWKERKFLVSVFKNKYVRFHNWKARRIPIWKLQLHDRRLEGIEFFMRCKELDLYGSGWSCLKNLPLRWQRALAPLFAARPHLVSEIEDKKSTIARYRFCLCLENVSFPGYVTEKIIDCLVAGVIPVYLGAPDIGNFVPQRAFVDAREYPDWGRLRERLHNMSQAQAKNMIDAGQEFLRTPEGRLHSYEGFADFIAGLVFQELGNEQNERVSKI